MQYGRVGKLRKSKILNYSALICFLICLFLDSFSFFYLKIYNLWFYIFCFSVGIYLIMKSFLFTLDSSYYFGSLLFFVGIIGMLCKFFNLANVSVYFIFSFALASIFTFLRFKQFFHLIVGLILAYEGLILYFFLNLVINFNIFLVLNIILFFIFLFLCAIIFKTRKKGA